MVNQSDTPYEAGSHFASAFGGSPQLCWCGLCWL